MVLILVKLMQSPFFLFVEGVEIERKYRHFKNFTSVELKLLSREISVLYQTSLKFIDDKETRLKLRKRNIRNRTNEEMVLIIIKK